MKTSRSAATAAARSTWVSGLWASTRSVRPSSIPRYLKILAVLLEVTRRTQTVSSSVAPPTSPVRARKTLWAWTVATFFGAGLGTPGPGTWGSVAAVLLWAAYAWLLHPTSTGLLVALLCGIALTIVLGVPAATIAARESGRHDPSFVVIDEVAGQWITLLGSPFGWRSALLALVLF